MRKEELAEMIRDAIEISDEVDAKHDANEDQRHYYRLSGFVQVLAMRLKVSDPQLAQELEEYRQRVSEGK